MPTSEHCDQRAECAVTQIGVLDANAESARVLGEVLIFGRLAMVSAIEVDGL